jgi:hypothetical protein
MLSRVGSVGNGTPTLWSATHGAPGSPFVFAIASEDGVITIDQQASLCAWMHPPVRKSGHRTAIYSVGCLSQYPSVILGGARNGKILFFDVRRKAADYQSGNKGITHPSSVYQIKQLNDNIIVVAGLESTLCNYDIRFIQQRPRDKVWPIRDWARTHLEVSNPVLIYPEHSNTNYTDLGFDIDPEAGIVAAVQENEFYTVNIFSSKTGQVLRSLNPALLGPAFDLTRAGSLRFVHDQDSRHMKSLWVAKGTEMIRYAW